MVTNPGNPTGVVLTPEEMRMLVDVAKAARPVPHRRRGVPGVRLRRGAAAIPAASSRTPRKTSSSSTPYPSASPPAAPASAAIITRNRELMAHAMKLCPVPPVRCPPWTRWPAAALYRRGARSTLPPSARSISAAGIRWCRSSRPDPRRSSASVPDGAFYVMATPAGGRRGHASSTGCWRSSRTTATR